MQRFCSRVWQQQWQHGNPLIQQLCRFSWRGLAPNGALLDLTVMHAPGLDSKALPDILGARHNLPQTIQQLEPLWDTWLQEQVLRKAGNNAR